MSTGTKRQQSILVTTMHLLCSCCIVKHFCCYGGEIRVS